MIAWPFPVGAGCLAGYTASIREEGALERQLRLLIKVHGLREIVLIAHQDRAYYSTVRWRNQSLEKQQLEDLSKAARRHPQIRGGGRERILRTKSRWASAV